MAKAGDKSTPVIVWEVPGSREPQASPERSLAEEAERHGQELRRALLTGVAFLRGFSTPLSLPEPPAGEPIASLEQKRGDPASQLSDGSPDLSPPPPIISASQRCDEPASSSDRHERPGPQMRRVLQALKKLYPPDGKVPDDVSTEAVRGRVSAELAADTRMQELAAPSWDTVNRALDRG